MSEFKENLGLAYAIHDIVKSKGLLDWDLIQARESLLKDDRKATIEALIQYIIKKG